MNDIEVIFLTIGCTVLYFWMGIGTYRLCENELDDAAPAFITVILWPFVLMILALKL